MPTATQLPHRKRAFLETFRRTGNVSQSAAAAGVDRKTAYNWQEHDDTFALEYHQAEIEATESLEAEAHRRAMFGVPKYKGVYYKGTLLEVIEEREYSDTLLIFLLKARAPDKYRERLDVRATVEAMAVGYAQADVDLINGRPAS